MLARAGLRVTLEEKKASRDTTGTTSRTITATEYEGKMVMTWWESSKKGKEGTIGIRGDDSTIYAVVELFSWESLTWESDYTRGSGRIVALELKKKVPREREDVWIVGVQDRNKKNGKKSRRFPPTTKIFNALRGRRV
jgi:hypothetical protein